MASYNENKFGLIILGNSGVGKSFLANILLDKEAFKHEFSARSVTHRTEFQEITFGDHRYAIFNIPGLIEADQTRVDINKREIDHAFTQRPNSLIIYVFGQQNGRIRDEDAVAFNAINAAYPLSIESLLLVVNGLPATRPKNYEGEVMLMLQDIIKVPVTADRVSFLNHINRESFEERQALKNQLLSVIVELSPTEHIKTHDIHLKVDEVAMLKKQIEEMTKAFEQNKIYFQNEIREQQKRYDDLATNQKNEADHFRRIIERQTEEAKEIRQEEAVRSQNMQKAYTSQLLAMQNQMKAMQAEHERLTQEMGTKNKVDSQLIRQALEASNRAQTELTQKILELQNRPPVVVQGKKKSCFVAGTLRPAGHAQPVRLGQVTVLMMSAATCGLILLGNSGVGKSFLANRLLDDDEAFESRFSARSVTRHTEWKDMQTVDGKRLYSVANIPGLVEANQKLIDENRIEIMKAFEQCPFAIVLFVFGHKNGRIPDEDLVAFMRINHAYEFLSKSLLIIVNGIPTNPPNDYQEKTTQLLHELTHVDKKHIYFIEKITSEENKKVIHRFLHEAVAKCEPTYHTRKHDIELLADEISRLKMETKERQDQLLAQEEEHSKRQKLDLIPDAIQKPYRPPQHSLTATIEPIPDSIDNSKQFNELMKTKHDQYKAKVEEQLLHDSDRDAETQELARHVMNTSERNRELITRISTSPHVTVIPEKRKHPIIKTISNILSDVLRPSRYHEPHHPNTPPHDTDEHSSHPLTDPPQPYNSHRRKPTNN
ncbi:unnamed protein product [Didymodactylos carnosus]|uniref:AIG1-type G domain-containing protein n=1 Tax=Didymodactylos carnosus TaxID=1234261 RepID=A0A814JEF9_9BILA|nr:unnamed protein product [Didymodactylos carnosus]CAF1035738.1 unnamed protein product [Didymodactylos carnosus]CAF3659681.1 unnamed protein product [Didymodactylos carnosus]CAF3806343.1 unnamed protein product [Didymodactylos carnosus]